MASKTSNPNGGFAPSVGKKVIPGATYILEFTYQNPVNINAMSVDVRECSTGQVLPPPQDYYPVGYGAYAFTVPLNSSGQVRIKWAVYVNNNSAATNFTLSKIRLRRVDAQFSPVIASVKNRIGDKNYELANHLGNVLQVIKDRKLPVFQSNTFKAYTADVVSFSDYYPYGTCRTTG